MKETKLHLKLVRDKIPEVISRNPRLSLKYSIVEGWAKRKALFSKLHEEVLEAEYADAKSVLGELADVMEVVYALADSFGYGRIDLEEARAAKLRARGGFKKGIFLEWVEEETEAAEA